MSDTAVQPRRAPARPTGTVSGPPGRTPGPLTHTAVMTARALRLSSRNIDALITSLALPIMLMLIFVYFFGGAIDTGSEYDTYVMYVVPGVLLLSAGFGAATTATAVSEDMKGGIIDRFRSLDVGGTPVLAGHVAASTVRNLCATALVFGVALLIGFRPAATWSGWLLAAAVLIAYIVALSWLSAAIGLLARTPEAASGFTFFMSFLPYPSSAFVRTESMPDWLHGFADHQPITPAIESLRGLLLGQEMGGTPWIALAWAAGMLTAAVAASGTLFRIRTR
ncbi:MULTISPECIES: ABC transporter permease [Streptomyces]|uniref:ABC transporter permease n=1 Tax=Streptomyces TaxID=1883 RepID=UPI0004BD5F3E|nr:MULTISPECIES: ABC transporter permease [Streptomyces]KOG82058.1 multidrug ABC transporter permease [Streptomyces griseus subsp. rhodochrous]KOU06415.1 multidrug ABC transporter permease [Streptomyces sp. NRRL F-2295]MBD3547457.1 ABC transporter permease [Streptomyces sp. JV180]NEA07509.1 ABC transporter permease [Streptomyces sp. SID10692]